MQVNVRPVGRNFRRRICSVSLSTYKDRANLSPSFSKPCFAPPMPRMKHTAGRGRGRSDRSAPREEPPRVNTKKTAQNRGGHRAASAGVRQPSNPVPPSPRTPDSTPEELNTRAIQKPGPRPAIQWYQCNDPNF